jgi:hypothetical protein
MTESTPSNAQISQLEDRSKSPDDSPMPPILQDNRKAWDSFPWSKFPGWVKTTRPGALTSWIWRYGFDIELVESPYTRKWVCQRCLKK